MIFFFSLKSNQPENIASRESTDAHRITCARSYTGTRTNSSVYMHTRAEWYACNSFSHREINAQGYTCINTQRHAFIHTHTSPLSYKPTHGEVYRNEAHFQLEKDAFKENQEHPIKEN